MSNAVKGEFDLTLGGATYRFKVGFGAMVLAQEQIGKELGGKVPTWDQVTVALEEFRLLFVRAFLWAGLREYHPDVTLAGMTRILDSAEPSEILVLMAGLKQSTTPDPRDVAVLEAAGARPTTAPATAAATTPTPTTARTRGRGRSSSRRARPA